MLRQDFFLVADQQGEVDDVFQFADVAWPGIALEDPLGLHADGRHRQVQALGIDTDEVFRQRQDVSRTFAQWRQAQAAVVQVLLQAGQELAGAHRLVQVDAGGGDQAHVMGNRLLRADPQHLAFLQRL